MKERKWLLEAQLHRTASKKLTNLKSMNDENLNDPLGFTAAVLMILNGVFGIVCNGLIVYIYVTSSTERYSFNLVCVFRALGNCLILGWGFLGTFVPMTIFGDSLFSPIYQTIVITSINSAYAGLHHCGFFIAVNRFCAMYFPRFYSKVFSVKFTFIIMLILVTSRVISTVVECNWNIPNKCFYVFSHSRLSWVPIGDPICLTVPPDVVVYSVAVFVLVLILLNLATLIKIYFFFKKVQLEEHELQRKMRKNKVLFMQTVIQDLIVLIDMLFTYNLNELIAERYWTFISGTFVWQCVHSFDGLIMMMCNERLTLLKKTLFPSSSSPSVVPKAILLAPSSNRKFPLFTIRR